MGLLLSRLHTTGLSSAPQLQKIKKMLTTIRHKLSQNPNASLTWFLLGLLFPHLGQRLLPLAPSLPSPLSLWKWRSTNTARFAAGVSGSWACLSLLLDPELRKDLMLSSSPSSRSLISFSIGVHVSEALDMLLHGQLNMLFVHHFFVILCFSGALFKKVALGFAVLSLVTELNSVFNKTRILYLVSGLSKASKDFQWIAYLNVATFAIRMIIIGWMNKKSFSYTKILPKSFILPCILGITTVNFWNISVFRQLIVSDIVKFSNQA